MPSLGADLPLGGAPSKGYLLLSLHPLGGKGEQQYGLMHILVYLGRSKNLGCTFSAHVPQASKLQAFADSNWAVTRSVTGFVIMLAGASILAVSRRQHCITMSSCEAELVALCDLAIELLHIVEVVAFLGHRMNE